MMIPSGNRDKLPGVPNYAVHIKVDEISEQQLLDDSTEVLTEIPLSMAIIRYVTPKKTVACTFEILNDLLGDPLARQTEELLRRHMLYPGDDLRREEAMSDDRFHVYRISETHYVIMDCATHLWKDQEIHTNLLINPAFHIVDWYAKWLEPPWGIPTNLRQSMQNHISMGDALGQRVAFLLNYETRYLG